MTGPRSGSCQGCGVMIRCVATILAVVLTVVAASAAETRISASAGDGLRAIIDSEHQIFLVATPQHGDAWTRLALRLTGDAYLWKQVADLNGMSPNLHAGARVKVPFAILRPELRKDVVEALFPRDESTRHGWVHEVALAGALEGESLWRVAEWFSGDGANYVHIRAANPSQPLSTRPGDRILIPNRILSPEFHSVGAGLEDEILLAEDDPANSDAPTVVHADLRSALPALSPIDLEYETSTPRPYAIYRLQKGEALYSSVVIRLTGRVYAKDVNDVVDDLVRFNEIADVSKLPVGYQVRVPMEFLTPEYRPPGDPVRIEYEKAVRDRARFAKRVEAKDLAGVHVVIDPGHGGRDVGTTHGGIWESTYVYDVAARLKAILEKKTAATVEMTTRSKKLGYAVPQSDLIDQVNDHAVLTNPQYALDDPIVGVNLRWYLANSIYRRAVANAAEPEKVIFISLHADSLHPSLRGAMAYIPGERFVQGTYTKKDEIYLARAEVKESPTVTLTRDEALRAEALSHDLAKSLIDTFAEAGLNVHPFEPVRSHVIRNRREWVPAVIRYNKIPTRLLLEICNLGNQDDRKLLMTRDFRQEVAEAIHDGIVAFFEQREKVTEPQPTVTTAAR